MKFPGTSETPSGAGQAAFMSWSSQGCRCASIGMWAKPAIQKRCAVVSLGGRDPAEDAAEAMVVVIGHEARQSDLGLAQAAEELTVEHLSLEHQPEGLDRAVRPVRAGSWCVVSPGDQCHLD